jgi:hypothetical protein
MIFSWKLLVVACHENISNYGMYFRAGTSWATGLFLSLCRRKNQHETSYALSSCSHHVCLLEIVDAAKISHVTSS